MAGWIKLHRSLLDWEWYDDPNTLRLLVHLLITVNHETSRYRGHDVPAGSRVAGRKSLALELGLSEKSIRTALEHLKQAGEVAIQSASQFSIISMLKWDKLQVDGPTDGPADGQRAASKGPHLKKGRMEEGKKKESIPAPLWLPLDDWEHFREHRKKIGKVTEHSFTLLLGDLTKLQAEGQDPAAVLQQSIKRGWKGLFAIKGDDHARTHHNGNTRLEDELRSRQAVHDAADRISEAGF